MGPVRPAVGWQASFPAARVGAYLDVDFPRVMVIGAGTEDPSAAASALVAALRASGKTRVVMDQAALGDVASLDDDAIVKKAARLPLDRVIIARVFPGGGDAPATAVVTIYDTTGKTQRAFTAQEGTAVADVGESSGVSSAAQGAVDRVLRNRPQGGSHGADDGEAGGEKSEAEREWLRRAVWFQDWQSINSYGTVVRTWSVALRGVQREPLPGALFYAAIDRPDLAASYTRMATTKWVIWSVGLAAAIASAPLFYWALTNSDSRAPQQSEVGGVYYNYAGSSLGAAPWGIAGGVLGAGLVLLTANLFLRPNPVPADEARRMAIEWDRKLRDKLGLPPLRDDLSRAGGIRDLALAPSVGPAGGGLQLSFRF